MRILLRPVLTWLGAWGWAWLVLVGAATLLSFIVGFDNEIPVPIYFVHIAVWTAVIAGIAHRAGIREGRRQSTLTRIIIHPDLKENHHA